MPRPVNNSPGSFDSSAISAGLLRSLVAAARPVSYAANQTVFDQDDPADSLYLVRQGILEVSTLSSDGRKHALNILKKGDLFGEIALIDGGTRSATVRTIVATRLLRITRAQLLAQVSRHPELGISLLSVTVSRLRWVIASQEEQAFQSLEVRLARRLSYLMSVLGNTKDELAMSQSDLAEHVGVTREAAAKCLADWQRKGLVSLGRRKITITDRPAISKISNG